MGEKRGDAHPLGKLEKVSTDSAVSKRVQNNSGMERTSLLLIVRKGGREKQEKKVKKKRERKTDMAPNRRAGLPHVRS